MTHYNYKEAVKDDVKQYIEEEINYQDYESVEELKEHLNNTLWAEDNVTGNGSGTYTFNSWEAEEYLAHNLYLLSQAMSHYGINANEALEKGAEHCDVIIRCYVLSDAIEDAINELEIE